MSRQKSSARVLMFVIVAVFALTVLAPIASYAGSEGKRNTAVGLAGLSAYLLIKGKTVPGLVTAAGAGYAYDRYQKERDEERYRDRYGYYRDGKRYDDHNRYYDRDRDRDRDCDRHKIKKGKKHDDNGRRVRGEFGRRAHGFDHNRGRR